MPTLISETDVRLEKSDLLRRVVLPRAVSADGFLIPPARTPGLHLSGLLRYVAQKSKITAYINDVAEEDLPIRWMLGQVFEEFAASLFPFMVWQPGEVDTPVIMTPDGVSAEDYGLLLHEFKSLPIPLISTSQGLDTADSNPCGQLIMGVLMCVADWERQNLLERCAAGIKSAKNRGVVFGRPKKLHMRRDEVLELKQQGVSIRGIARELKMPPASVHKIIKSTAKE